jgi:uncharacterized protein YegJ (DUF2314 family)
VAPRISLPAHFDRSDDRISLASGWLTPHLLAAAVDWESYFDGEMRLFGRATIINRPQVLAYREGQSVRFDEADIMDWCYRQSDRLVGGESMRLMLTKLPPRKARAMAAEIGL